MGPCDCVTDAHRCVSLNGAGEECGHDISIHSSVATDQKCLMTGCGCSFFTMLGLLHPSRHQVNCVRFVSQITKNAFMKVLAEMYRARDALQEIDMLRVAAPSQVWPVDHETNLPCGSTCTCPRCLYPDIWGPAFAMGQANEAWRVNGEALAEDSAKSKLTIEDSWSGLSIDAVRMLRRACERPGNLTLPRAAVTDRLDRITSLESANAEFAIANSDQHALLNQIANDEAKLVDACDEIAMLRGALTEDHALRMPYVNDWKDERNKRHAAEAKLKEAETRIEKMERLLDDNYRKRLEKE